MGHKTRRAGNGTSCEYALHIRLRSTNLRVTRRAHRIMAEIWLPQPTRPINELVVDHIDGNSLNNHASNLQWVSNVENLKRIHQLKNEKKRLTNISLGGKLDTDNVTG